MNFSTMEYFTVLAQERSFTKAAERLHITQQSLSSHIAGVERELGCRLLERQTPLRLTYAGEVLLRYAKEFRQEHTAILREFGDISQNQRGVLRVGVSAVRSRAIIPQTLGLFQAEYPNIAVELYEGSNESLLRRLTEGAIDLAIADFPKALQGVLLRDFYCEEMVLLIEKGLFAAVFGAGAAVVEKRMREGDFSPLAACPFVLGAEEDIDGRIGRAVLRRAAQGRISRLFHTTSGCC